MEEHINIKKKKALVMYSHNTHAFIGNELKYASKNFEYVLLLCPDNIEIFTEAKKYNNIKIKPVIDTKSIKAFVKGCNITKSLVQSELKSAISSHCFSKRYFKLFFLYMTHTAFLDNAMRELLKKYNEDEIVVLSLWFSSTSFATAVMKIKHPGITAISLAHSFEVDEKKNRYVKNLFKKECHEMLDAIYFISNKVKDDYIRKYALPSNWQIGNIDITYLGVEKKCPGLSEASKNPPFRLVSCSHCVPVKRIDLIARALCMIKDKEVEWIHIGDGPTRLSVMPIVSNMPSNIKTVFLGKQTNDFVHKYLSENSVDAFINVSSSEGLPVTLMEAIAYGIPIIATNVGGTSELFVSEIGVLLCSDPTEKEVSDAIRSIFSQNDAQIDIMRNNANQCYKNNFDASILRMNFYYRLSQY